MTERLNVTTDVGEMPAYLWLPDSGIGPGLVLIEEAMARVQRLDWDTTVADAVAALHHLRGRDEVDGRVGVIGFCLGGGVAYNVAAVADPDVLVSYYGSSIPG